MSPKRKDRKGGEIKNSKARHRFNIGETFEAGIVLQGTEVKTIREGRAQIHESFARFSKNELFLYNTHIEEYAFGNYANHAATRPRKLLLNRRELNKIRGALDIGNQTCVPLRMYLKHGLVKVEIALCTGKKLFDKRQDLKKKTDMREAQRAMKHHNQR
ncbi:MAG: SsrA-binding protein SmpB [Verrucomicrobiota bacterium]